MSETLLEGGCACGAVRYRLTGKPISVNNCYCTLCQRQTGSTSVVNAFYESDRVELLSGELVGRTVASGSGGAHLIRSCSVCGTAISSHYPRFGSFGAGVRVGTLDDPGALRPDAAIFTAFRMPWVTLPEGIPAFDGAYNPSEFLSAEAVDRFRQLARKQAEAKDLSA